MTCQQLGILLFVLAIIVPILFTIGFIIYQLFDLKRFDKSLENQRKIEFERMEREWHKHFDKEWMPIAMAPKDDK
jgi:hypothetical protein